MNTMYATFAGSKTTEYRGDKHGRTTIPTSPSFEAPLRPKRQQVARACDSCRMHRRKCDNNVPCKNCVSRGEQCVNKSPGERRTLPQAYREIDRLNQKVKDLEEQLESERRMKQTMPPQSDALTPPNTANASPVCAVEGNTIPSHQPDLARQSSPGGRPIWGGVMTSTGQTSQKTWYGPSSLFYYIHRMNTYLSAVFQQLHPDDLIQLKTVAKTFATPDCNPTDEPDKSDSKSGSRTVTNDTYLTPNQEEYFLNLYWQSFHATIPILDETDFKKHYRSLVTKPTSPRKPSALVDIVIAISMQKGVAMAQRNSSRPLSATEVGKDDPSIAGRLYYRRCQRLLYNEQETPTLTTIQCYVLSSAYTCCAAFQNMSHIALSVAIRSAHMIGLHIEAPSNMPAATRELRKRIWWQMCVFETKTCMKLGRPFETNVEEASCGLPADDHVTASLTGSEFGLMDDHTTWLTYCLYNTKLMIVARQVHTAFYDKYAEFYQGKPIHDDPEALERYAKFLSTATGPLDAWVESVPDMLRTKRANGGKPLSTDRSPIVMEEQFIPPWLQLQRLKLELMYHIIRSDFYRTFICFPSLVAGAAPLGDTCLSLAVCAVEHSMAVTHIFHTAVEKIDLLVGWHEAFQWQWNAALNLAGYLFAYPMSSNASIVREAIDMSIVVFEEFGRCFGTSLGAAMVMRDLAIKIDFLRDLVRSSPLPALISPNTQEPPADGYTEQNVIVPATLTPTATVAVAANGTPYTENYFADSMDIAYAIDNSGDPETLWPPIGNMSDQWWLQVPATEGGLSDLP
ncbi:hypothetical protein GGR50DRAFT_663732 [Xylaria sp. CBS 124048]|nr:hypothetical protein GGR50DRAFT_663732 [Xylaria sp. CBS 124048]